MPIELHTKSGAETRAERATARAARRDRTAVEIGLNAAILAIRNNEPNVLVVRQDGEARTGADSLPFGPFTPEIGRAHV